MYVDVRHPISGKLLFQYDPCRNEVRMRSRGEVIDVPLCEYGGMLGGTVVNSPNSLDNCAAVR